MKPDIVARCWWWQDTLTTQMSWEKMCSRDLRFQDARQEMIRLVLHVLHKPFCLSFYSWESELLEFMLLKVHYFIEFCHRQFCLYSHIFWPSWFAMVHVHEMDTQSITTFYHLLASTPCLPAWLLDIWTYRITSGWVTSVQHTLTPTQDQQFCLDHVAGRKNQCPLTATNNCYIYCCFSVASDTSAASDCCCEYLQVLGLPQTISWPSHFRSSLERVIRTCETISSFPI